jgi:hypothetical protein
MFNKERGDFSFQETKSANKKTSRFPTRFIKSAVLAGALALGPEARPAVAQQVAAVEQSGRAAIIFDAEAHGVMERTSVVLKGNGLRLIREKKDIDFYEGRSLKGVEIIAQGGHNLLLKISENPKEAGEEIKITEIRIENGYLQKGDTAAKK